MSRRPRLCCLGPIRRYLAAGKSRTQRSGTGAKTGFNHRAANHACDRVHWANLRMLVRSRRLYSLWSMGWISITVTFTLHSSWGAKDKAVILLLCCVHYRLFTMVFGSKITIRHIHIYIQYIYVYTYIQCNTFLLTQILVITSIKIHTKCIVSARLTVVISNKKGFHMKIKFKGKQHSKRRLVHLNCSWNKSLIYSFNFNISSLQL